VRPAHADLRIENSADLVYLCGAQAWWVWAPLWDHATESGKQAFCGEVVAGQDQAGTKCLLETRAEARRSLDIICPEQGEDSAESPSAAKPFAIAESRALPQEVDDLEGVLARLRYGTAKRVLAVARLNHYAVGTGAHDRFELPILDLENDDAEIGTYDSEIRVAIADADVVVDEVVLREVLAESREDLALTGGRSVVLVREALGDSERHVPIVSRAADEGRELPATDES